MNSFITETGHIPTVSFSDWSIRRACDPNQSPELPDELRASLLIQQFMHFALQEINAFGPITAPDNAQFYTTLAVLEEKFSILETSLCTKTSWHTRLRLQSARLYLQLSYFLDDGSSAEHAAAILRTYDTAFTLISELIVGEEESYDLLPYAPMSTARWIYCAALVIFRVTFSSYSTNLDRTAAKVTYNAAAFSMRQLSVRDSRGADLLHIPMRVAEILRALWRRGEQDSLLRSLEPRLEIKTRLGNNIIADSMRLLRGYRIKELSVHPEDPRPDSQPNPLAATGPQAESGNPLSSGGVDNQQTRTDAGLASMPEAMFNEADFAGLLDPFSELAWSQDLDYFDFDPQSMIGSVGQ